MSRAFRSDRFREIFLHLGVGIALRSSLLTRTLEVSITFVRLSAIWALDGTPQTATPVDRCSLINRACSKVLNSWHAGGAVLLTKSKRLLQSVATMESCFPMMVNSSDSHLEIGSDPSEQFQVLSPSWQL